jgi:hypothetical protein
MITTHGNFVGISTTKNYNFDSHSFPQIATLMEIPRETPWKIVEKETPPQIRSGYHALGFRTF